MSHPIKYRAWDKRSGEIEEVWAVAHDSVCLLKHFLTAGQNPPCFQLIQNFELMQYTGLRDKNSVDIYEGDVVEWPSLFEPRVRAGVVEWRNFAWSFGNLNDPNGENLTVIGNIYENPELVERVS